jgi:hypothetical protein
MVLYRIRGATFIMRGSRSGMVAVGERARGFECAVVGGVLVPQRRGFGRRDGSCAVEVGALTGVGSCGRNVSAGHAP